MDLTPIRTTEKTQFNRKYRRLDKPPYTYVAMTTLAIQVCKEECVFPMVIWLDIDNREGAPTSPNFTPSQKYRGLAYKATYMQIFKFLFIRHHQIDDYDWVKFFEKLKVCFHSFEAVLPDGKIPFDIILGWFSN